MALRIPLIAALLAVAAIGCGTGDSSATEGSSGEGWRLAVTPGAPGKLHLLAHVEGLAAAEGMIFATGRLVVRDPTGAPVLVDEEAISIYVPAPAEGAVDPQLEVALPPGLPPARYLVELTLTDQLGGRRFPMAAAVDVPWPAPVVPPGFGVRPIGGKSAGPATANAGEEVTLTFEVHGHRVEPSGAGMRVALETDVVLEHAPAGKTPVRRATRAYRAEAPFISPLLELRFRVRLPPDLEPGAYGVRLDVRDTLAAGATATVAHVIQVEPPRVALGPPAWETATHDDTGTIARARLPVGAGRAGVGLDVHARVVALDGTVVAVAAAPVHFDTLEASPRELAVTIALPAGLPSVPLRLGAGGVPPAPADAGVVGGEWALPALAPVTAKEPASPRLEVTLRESAVASGGAVTFEARLLAPPAPVLDEAKAPGVRGLEITFGATLVGPKGTIVLKEARADVVERVPFIPREVGLTGLILTPSDAASGTYILRVTAREPRIGGSTWSADVPLSLTR